MSQLSPSAQRRAKQTAALHRRPEQRPAYRARRIVRSVEIRFSLPPTTNSLFGLVVGRGRIATPKYRAWRDRAVLDISTAVPEPGRIAGRCDIEIHHPPFSGKPEHRKQPCLDAAVSAGIIASDGEAFVRNVVIVPTPGATSVRMILTAIPADEQAAAEIELRHRDGMPAKLIAIATGVSLGQVETVIAGLKR